MRAVWLLVAIAVLALNLRPPFTAPGALLPDIAADLHMSTTLAGLLPTLPVVCLGVFALAAPPLRRRWGDEGVIAVCIPLLVLGSLLRAAPAVGPFPWVALFGGTIVVGAAVGIANVALPALIKREFASRVTQVTSLYTVFLTLGSSVAAATAVPVMHAAGGNWRVPLLALAGLALLTGLVWLPPFRSALLRIRLSRSAGADTAVPAATAGTLLRSPLAWQVTAFMGLQSLLAYVVFGWMPTVAQDRGLDATAAGLALSLSTLVQAVGAMCLPLLVGRRDDQRLPAVGLFGLSALGLLGFFLAPLPWIWVSSVVLGFGMGALFGLALSVIGLRAPDAAIASRLSGMAQAVGYLLAALGPLLVGVLHDLSGAWFLPLCLLLVVCLSGAAAALGAGRPLHVGATAPEPARSSSELT
ncbi:CP family cyanate transporter-like MFS transporter [Halopolyspora algeriensis]|uniref:CP family cyanate transporter-like MFS transporter n=1 Tax=Halopolyspora algeriensis TaxID=1500506 RepID=A0A368VZ78_9ACTN|nr:MFS transporter [Halopolyspora algeriensis]RCW47261.1 CP family cyanate transporter-like MFS transporter [Halopolyspora algeriensis]TQM42497.1 CP family cyanate transporter-like MFS transporter [Halopolyspora algeriensis]